MTSPTLARKVFANSLFSLADILIIKGGTILAFILLVRLLPNTAIAAVGIATGYLVFIAYLDVAPIKVLLRDYPKVAGDAIRRDRLLTALFGFWCLQTLTMLLLAGAVIIWVIAPLEVPGLPFLYFAMVVDFIALSLQGWLKVVYYTDFQQRFATRIGLLIGAARLAGYSLLLLSPSLMTYSWILVVSALLAGVIWVFAFVRRFHFRPSWHEDSPALLFRTLTSYGLWDHLNRLVLDTLLTVDLVILSWFVGLRDMSNYTVALKFATMLTLIPVQLYTALQVASANYEDTAQKGQAIGALLKINGIVSIAQFVGALLFGPWLMMLLFGQSVDAEAVDYMLVLAGGITLLNLCLPLAGVINNHCRLDAAFAFVFLPVLISGIAVYCVAAMSFGATGIAWGNVVTYGLLAAGLIAFVAKCSPVTLERKLITPAEAALLRRLFKGATE